MSRRIVALLAPLAVAAAVVGCTRTHARTDRAGRLPPPVRTAGPVAAPAPPVAAASDAADAVRPPRPTDTAGAPRSPSDIVPIAATLAEPVALDAADDRKTLPERRDERKDRREQRRDDRKADEIKPPPALPSPYAKEPAKPAESPRPAGDNADLDAARRLLQLATQKYDGITDFEARLVRREVMGRDAPTEEILLQFRKRPFSVYMRNTGDAGRGREVLYVDGKYDGKMHVVTGEGDNRLMGVGFRTSLDPNSKLVTSKSRHRITEAGFTGTLANYRDAVARAEQGRGGVRSLGQVSRKEYPYPLDGIEVTLAPGDDPLLPKGGKRHLFFDTKPDSPSRGLPVVVLTYEPGDREVEYYAFDRFRLPANLTDADFSPERLGRKR